MATNDPKTLVTAFLGGVVPALVWLYFWIKQESKKPEPKGVITILFIMGMVAVIFVLPVQKFIQANISSYEGQIVGWATVEEIMKYLAVMVILYRSSYIDEPIDWPIFFITTALGFAALENTLFLIKPLSLNETTVSLLTGQLRFLGSTLLHTVSTGIVGISLGFSLHMEGFRKKLYPFFGIILAIALHSVFNFFIMKDNGSNFLKVLGFLWVVTIIIMLIFEKLRRMD